MCIFLNLLIYSLIYILINTKIKLFSTGYFKFLAILSISSFSKVIGLNFDKNASTTFHGECFVIKYK